MKYTLLLALALIACTATTAEQSDGAIPSGAKYVAMGSSFAAGPGITSRADTSRCGRSNDNYARQLARRHALQLTDVSCGGATTAHLLGPWDELPPQVDAVDADTRLVTITIGGNDLGYVGRLMRAACAGDDCEQRGPPSEADYEALEQSLQRLVAEVRERAPHARIVFVDYVAMLPPNGVCAATVISEAKADESREVARRLAEITARAAERGGAETLTASRMSENHSACGAEPWATGSSQTRGVPAYHPNLAGMTAIADALDQLIWP